MNRRESSGAKILTLIARTCTIISIFITVNFIVGNIGFFSHYVRKQRTRTFYSIRAASSPFEIDIVEMEYINWSLFMARDMKSDRVLQRCIAVSVYSHTGNRREIIAYSRTSSARFDLRHASDLRYTLGDLTSHKRRLCDAVDHGKCAFARKRVPKSRTNLFLRTRGEAICAFFFFRFKSRPILPVPSSADSCVRATLHRIATDARSGTAGSDGSKSQEAHEKSLFGKFATSSSTVSFQSRASTRQVSGRFRCKPRKIDLGVENIESGPSDSGSRERCGSDQRRVGRAVDCR